MFSRNDSDWWLIALDVPGEGDLLVAYLPGAVSVGHELYSLHLPGQVFCLSMMSRYSESSFCLKKEKPHLSFEKRGLSFFHRHSFDKGCQPENVFLNKKALQLISQMSSLNY